MTKLDLYKIYRSLILVFLAFLAAFIALELFFSFQWRMQHDTPILHYIAYMIDRYGFVPYRDIYEQSMPGIYLFHLLIGKLLGYSDHAFELVNIVYTLLTLTATWVLLQPFGRKAALGSTLFFGLVYLGFGPNMVLQRDYVGILPLILALILVTRESLPWNPYRKMLLAGVLIGLDVSIKPHLGIALPILVVYATLKSRAENPGGFIPALLRLSLAAAAGVVLGGGIPFLWLWRTGGLPYFWDLFSNYLPLYLHVNGNHIVLSASEQWGYILQNYVEFGGLPSFFYAACLGAYFILFVEKDGHTQSLGKLLLFLCLAYSIYPVLSAKFWPYHWMPFYYFASLLTGLLLSDFTPNPVEKQPASPAARGRAIFALTGRYIFPLLFLGLALVTIHPADDFMLQLQGKPPAALTRVDLVSDFLTRKMRPGDTVQPLDVVLGGVIQGMLISDAKIATPFIYDYQFHHDVSNLYIQQLRRKFIVELHQAKPRFIVEYTERPVPSGLDTSNDFPELKEFMALEYKQVYENKKIRIYERK